jgi:hypothetical protein
MSAGSAPATTSLPADAETRTPRELNPGGSIARATAPLQGMTGTIAEPTRHAPLPRGRHDTRRNGHDNTLPSRKHLFDTGCMEGWQAEQQRQQTTAWSPGQRVLNSTGARMPKHRLDPPVPVVVCIVWEDDGEEHIETEALGWTSRDVYVRLPDPRYRLTSVWLDAADVKRR